MSIIFAKDVGKEQGARIFEPLVDYNRETGEIYVPRYNTKDVLKAHEEGASRGYLSQGMKMVYVPYPVYQNLKTQLEVLLNKLSAIQQELKGLNISGHSDIPLWQFMLQNQSMLYGAGAKLLLHEDGGCCVITDKEYAELLHADDESEDDDIYGEECPEDDVPDEDPEEDEDEEPEEEPPHSIRIIFQRHSTDE